jgi:hypothetical protein
MAKRFLHHLSPALWARSLAVYGSGRLWQEVGYQAGRSRWAEVGAAIAFLWLLGCLGLSFVLLQLNQTHALSLAIVGPARELQRIMAVTDPVANNSPPSLWGLGIVGLGAWLCLVGGTQKLVQLVATVYSSGTSQPADWRSRLLPWGLTGLGLGITGLVFAVMDRGASVAQTGLAQGMGLLGRWVLALGIIALGVGLGYRLIPRRWTPGQPLWPGVRIVLIFGLGLLGLREWGVSWLARQDLAYALLPVLGLNLLILYGLILLVPVGAQINVSTLRHRGLPSRPWGAPAAAPPPPSFDSFKIKRRD